MRSRHDISWDKQVFTLPVDSMKLLSPLVAFAVAPLVSSSSVIDSRQTAGQTAYVDLGVTRGKPEHLASGWIYGIPDTFPNQIPNSWYTDVGFRWGKGGGGQLG